MSGRKLLVAAMIVDTLGGGLFAPFELVYALKVAHLSLTTSGLILSIAAVAGIALGPIAGAAIDRTGPFRVVAISNATGVTGCVALLLVPNALGYAIGAFLLSASQRVFWGAFTPLVASFATGPELERWFGRLRGARYVGIVSGEGLSGVVLLLGVEIGLRLLVIANAVSFVAALILVLAAAPPVSVHPHGPSTGLGGDYAQVLRDRINTVAAALNVGATFMLIAPIVFLPVFVLDTLQLPTWLPGVVAAFMTATAAIGLIFGSRLVRGRRRLRNLAIAAGLWTGGCAAFAIAPAAAALAYGALFFGALLLGIGEAMYAPTADALPAALAPVDLRGRYAAVHQMAWGISEATAPTAGALLLSVGAPVLWLTLSGVAATTALGYRILELRAGGRDGIAGNELAASSS